MKRADLRIILRAAERLELTARLKGERMGPIGHVGLEVLRELMRLVDYATGQLDPCYATIARNIRRARSAVIEAVKRLRRAGFIDWVRRYEDDPERRGERGPQVRQVSNAYRFCTPAYLKRLLGVFAEGAPAPEDDQDRRRDAELKRQRWEFEDSPLFKALQRMGAARDAKENRERESAQRSEPPPIFHSYKD